MHNNNTEFVWGGFLPVIKSLLTYVGFELGCDNYHKTGDIGAILNSVVMFIVITGRMVRMNSPSYSSSSQTPRAKARFGAKAQSFSDIIGDA